MNICIFQPDPSGYSETFLQAHAVHLPGRVVVVHGRTLPGHTADGRTLMDLLGPHKRLGWRFKHHLPGEFAGRLAPVPAEAYRRFLESAQIDVVLAEYGPTATLLSSVCRQSQIPLVAHFHGYDAYCGDVITNNAQYQQVFRSAAAIIAVSQDMKRQLLSLGCPPEKLHLNSYGIDTAAFGGTQPGLNPPHFVSVGRFVDKKAPQLTLLAFAAVARQVPDASLTMIGDGVLLEACRQIARSCGIQDRVQFRGALAPPEVRAEMNRARAFVQHSLRPASGDSEGTPLAVLEAGASGLPVVSTRHAGIPDAVIHEETGLLVEEGDVDGMASEMTRVAKDSALAARLGESARKRIEQFYGLEGSIQGLSSILDSAVRGK